MDLIHIFPWPHVWIDVILKREGEATEDGNQSERPLREIQPSTPAAPSYIPVSEFPSVSYAYNKNRSRMAERAVPSPDDKPDAKASGWPTKKPSPNVRQRNPHIRSASAPAPSAVHHGPLALDLRVPMENDPATESSATIWAMEREPKARRVRFDQLTAEIRAIYIAIVKLEAICTQQIAHYQQNNTSITPEQCVSLVELHKATIYEFSDFFLATQHPVAAHSRTLRECCLKYNMPQRLWLRVNSLFGLLRAHLPDLREHMTRFVSLSFSLYTVLYENAPVFDSTWSECLGDVARYGMASDIGLEERCIWAGASRMWYLRAADLDPGAGRLQHHLAILAMTEPMAQLFHFIKGLCAATPFGAARESIATLLDPVFSKQMGRCQTLDIATAKVHGMVIRNYDDEAFGMALLDYNIMLGDSIVADPAAWNSFGYVHGT